MELFYKNNLLGKITPDEMDPPFGSGFFTFSKELNTVAESAKKYLEYTFKEFELKEGSKLYNEFSDALENEFAEWHLSEDWYILDADQKTTIFQPMLSRIGLLVWSYE